MKKLVLFFCIAISIKATAQNNAQNPPAIYTRMEQMPAPSVDITSFLAQHINYPEDAREDGIEGRVVVEFVIDSLGKTSDFKILKSVHSLLDSEAIRVIRKMPNWIPGRQDGKPVNTHMTLPVVFQLGHAGKR